MKITFADETFELLPEGALFWERERALLVADLHLGKSAAFRAAGMPIPRGITSGDLDRLSALIHHCAAESVWFLGDLFHARESHSEEIQQDLARWRASHPDLALSLVRGNHDQQAGDPAEALRIELFEDPCWFGGIQLAHHPRPLDPKQVNDESGSAVWQIAGHLHPCVYLKDRHRSGMRLPCFFQRGSQFVLPAFGTFTGGHSLQLAEGDRVFVGVEGEVLELPVQTLQRQRRGLRKRRTSEQVRPAAQESH